MQSPLITDNHHRCHHLCGDKDLSAATVKGDCNALLRFPGDSPAVFNGQLCLKLFGNLVPKSKGEGALLLLSSHFNHAAKVRKRDLKKLHARILHPNPQRRVGSTFPTRASSKTKAVRRLARSFDCVDAQFSLATRARLCL